MDILFSSITAGLLLGLVFALVALGLTIIFGVMDIVNFAHGEFLMLGMYVAYFGAKLTGADPLTMLPVAAVFGWALGWACYKGFVRFLLRGPALAQLLGTFGLMLFLRNMAVMAFGVDEKALHDGVLIGVSYDWGIFGVVPATKLAAAALSAVSFLAIWFILQKTKTGKALVATSLSPQAARYMGISTERCNAFAWGLGGSTVCLAGALLINFWTASPYVGLLFTMIAFTVVALGGFGSVKGAFVAALVVGLITEIPGFTDFLNYEFGMSFLEAWPMTSLKYTFVYATYFLIMLVMPRGLFGWKH